MADALVERRPTARFFCHRCNIEFEDVLQDYTCPYCASGFIEQLEAEEGNSRDVSDSDIVDLDDVSNFDDMSNLDDSDDVHQSTPPVFNDLAFFLSSSLRPGGGRRETLMESLVWTIGGAARPNTGTVTAVQAPLPPFLLVGAPGDYVFGGEGLDAVVTQLLGQLENAGPPPLPREQIAAIPSEAVSAEQAAANTSCSVCWENFSEGEKISRLECDHIFHEACIGPWLQLHATCPICRRSLLPLEPEPAPEPEPALEPGAEPQRTDSHTRRADPQTSSSRHAPVLRRMARWRRPLGAWAGPAAEAAVAAAAAAGVTEHSSSSSDMSTSTNTTPRTPSTPPEPRASDTSNSSTSLTSSDRDTDRHYMDIDFE